MLLSEEERDKFAAYAEEQAQSNYKIVEQMTSINIPSAVIAKTKAEAHAFTIVAKILRETEGE